MNARLRQVVLNVWTSFWFLPAVMVALAVVLSEVTVNVDERTDLTDLRGLAWLYGGSADGARAMLAAIGGGMLGVAGTVFSITIAALSLASNTMGPRLLEHFTRDRGNSAALGSFIATFTYALLVLRTVRSGESAFVPHLAVTLGLLLALVNLGVLIYFIQHVATGINVGHVIRLVTTDLKGAIETQFPRTSALLPAPPDLERSGWSWSDVTADQEGYLQVVDDAALLKAAQPEEAFVDLLVRPGDFVHPGRKVARVHLVEGKVVRAALVIGSARTSGQDPEFAVRQLVEVAVRALSPGINDPFTAITVLDHLGAALCRVADRPFPSAWRAADGRVKLRRSVTTFDGLTDAMFHQIRQNGAAHPAVMIRLLETLTLAAERVDREARLGTLRRHADLTLEHALARTDLEADRADVRARHGSFHARLAAKRRELGS